MTEFRFDIHASDPQTSARSAVLSTPHGPIRTPVFMPVGTRATVKGIDPAALADLGADVILANTYHLFLRPGHELIDGVGGLHSFMGWNQAILTDSGGFQIFSLADTLKLDDGGVTFRSIVDGTWHRWTPEDNMAVQEALGADIIMQLDQCPPYPAEKKLVDTAVVRSAAWAARCKAAHRREDQALFGIVQGGVHEDLRLRSVSLLAEIGFPGYGIGGYSVGEPHELMLESLVAVCQALPQDAPRYLMGVGNPTTMLEAIALGVDMFDCVLPTRAARLGSAFSSEGRLNLRNAVHAKDPGPLDPACTCSTCRRFSRSYLRHLVNSKEMLGAILLTVHNLHYLIDLMQRARVAVEEGRYGDFLQEWRSSPASHDW